MISSSVQRVVELEVDVLEQRRAQGVAATEPVGAFQRAGCPMPGDGSGCRRALVSLDVACGERSNAPSVPF